MMSLVMLICLFMIIRALHVHYSFRPARKALDEQHTTAGRTNSSRRTHSTFFPNMAHESTQQATFSPLGYHNLRMNGLQNSSQTTHESAIHLPGWRKTTNPTHTQSLLSRQLFPSSLRDDVHRERVLYLFCFLTWHQDEEWGMEMVEGSHFHSRTSGIEGILVFFPFLFTFILRLSSSSVFVSRYLVPRE